MKREILFRGKDKKTGEWVEGSLDRGENRVNLLYDKILSHDSNDYWCSKLVHPETVQQLVCRINGVAIWEGARYECDGMLYVVEWCDRECGFDVVNIDGVRFTPEQLEGKQVKEATQ